MGLRVRVPRGCSCPPCRRHRPPASGFAELSKSASVCVIVHFGKMAEEGPEGLSNRAFGASVRLSGGFARAGEFENAARGRKGDHLILPQWDCGFACRVGALAPRAGGTARRSR